MLAAGRRSLPSNWYAACACASIALVRPSSIASKSAIARRPSSARGALAPTVLKAVKCTASLCPALQPSHQRRTPSATRPYVAARLHSQWSSDIRSSPPKVNPNRFVVPNARLLTSRRLLLPSRQAPLSFQAGLITSCPLAPAHSTDAMGPTGPAASFGSEASGDVGTAPVGAHPASDHHTSTILICVYGRRFTKHTGRKQYSRPAAPAHWTVLF